jgi:hypothetical protein
MLALVILAALFADTEPKPAKVEAVTHGPYFESNMSGLKGESSFLAFTDAKKFSEALRPVPPLLGGKKPNPLPKDAFEKSLVLVVIKRGSEAFEYTVEKAEDRSGTLVLTFKSKGTGGGGTATFASPLVVAVPKGKYKSAEFVENGKKVATVKIGG